MNKRIEALKRRIPLGTVFSRLTVIGYAKNQFGVWCLSCRCACGKQTVQRRDALKKGSIVSCGCFIREKISKYGIHKRLPPGECQLNSLFYRHGFHCKRKGVKTFLTKEQFKALITANCCYCGDAPFCIFTQSYTNGTFLYGGIDRINSGIDYVADNSVPCCKRCNTAKNDMTVDEFKGWLRRAALHLLNMK